MIKRNEHGDHIEAIEEYEEAMMQRSHEKMKDTWRTLELFFPKGAPKEFVRRC